MQGGPGYESPRPLTKSGWLKRALMDYKVLHTRPKRNRIKFIYFSHLFNGISDESISKYLTHFRADNIIRDAEFIRKKKLINNDRWNILGQSFGGFCAVTYLSYFPDSLDKVFITGGLPPIKSHPDDVYRSTYKRVLSKNKIFYETFPNSIEKVIRICKAPRKK